MKPRWNNDVLRGVLLAWSLYQAAKGLEAVRLGLIPLYQPEQFWISTFCAVLSLLYAATYAWPTRGRLQATFILSTAGAAIFPLLVLASAFNHFHYALNVPLHAYVSSAAAIAAACGTWRLYQAEPRS